MVVVFPCRGGGLRPHRDAGGGALPASELVDFTGAGQKGTLMKKMKQLDRKAFMLLLLWSKGPSGAQKEPIDGRVRLAKLLFLLKEEKWGSAGLDKLAQDFYAFEPYHFGPFDKNVFGDMDFLRSIGFVDTTPLRQLPSEEADEYFRALEEWAIGSDLLGGDDDEGVENIFVAEERYFEVRIKITDEGSRFVEQRIVPSALHPEHLAAIEFVKTTFGGWSLAKLLRYIYSRYPQMASKSKIRDQVLRT